MTHMTYLRQMTHLNHMRHMTHTSDTRIKRDTSTVLFLHTSRSMKTFDKTYNTLFYFIIITHRYDNIVYSVQFMLHVLYSWNNIDFLFMLCDGKERRFCYILSE